MKDENDFKKIEKVIKEENDQLISRMTVNMRDFKKINEDLNSKINESITQTDKLGSKFDNSISSGNNQIKHLTDVVFKKQGSICWFITFLFVLFFFLKKLYFLIKKINIDVMDTNETLSKL